MFKFTLGLRLGIQWDRTFQSGAAGNGEAGQPVLWTLLGWTVRSFAYLMHCVQLAAAEPRQREPKPAPPQTESHSAQVGASMLRSPLLPHQSPHWRLSQQYPLLLDKVAATRSGTTPGNPPRHVPTHCSSRSGKGSG